MKFLNQFVKFDLAAFLADKRVIATGIADWKDNETGKILGKVVDGVIY